MQNFDPTVAVKRNQVSLQRTGGFAAGMTSAQRASSGSRAGGAAGGAGGVSFKDMKAQARIEREKTPTRPVADDAEMAETSEIRELAEKQVQESKKKENSQAAFFDKVYNYLQGKVIVIGQNGLQEFPRVICRPGADVTFSTGEDA